MLKNLIFYFKYISSAFIKTFTKNVTKYIILKFLLVGTQAFILVILSRKLDLLEFGKLIYILALNSFILIFINFGFNWTGTRIFSINSNKKDYISKVFSSIIAIQMLLFLCSIVIVFKIQNFISTDINDSAIIISLLITFLSVFITPCLLNGTGYQRFSIYSKLLYNFALLIFIFANYENINLYSFLIFSLISIFLELIYFISIIRWYKIIHVVLPDFVIINELLVSCWRSYISISIVNAYTIAIPLLLVYSCGYVELALFAVADKIKNLVSIFFGSILEYKFPSVANLGNSNYRFFRKLLLELIFLIFILYLPILFSIYLLSELIIIKMHGINFIESSYILKSMIILPILIALNNIIGMQFLVSQGMDKLFLRISFVAISFILITSYFFINKINISSAVYLFIYIELIFLILYLFYFLTIDKSMMVKHK